MAAKPLTVAAAARQWEEAKRAIEDWTGQLEQAKAVLLDHFRTTGTNDYKHRVGYAHTTYLALNTETVKAELADRLADFQVRRSRETLSLLR